MSHSHSPQKKVHTYSNSDCCILFSTDPSTLKPMCGPQIRAPWISEYGSWERAVDDESGV